MAGCAAGGLLIGDALEPLADRLPKKLPLDRPGGAARRARRADTGIGRVPVAADDLPVPRHAPTAARRGAILPALRCRRSLTALVLAGLAVRFGATVGLAAYAVVGIALVAISVIDVESHIVPNRILYPAAFVAAPLFVLTAAVDHRWGSLWHAAAAPRSGSWRCSSSISRTRRAWGSATSAWPVSWAAPPAGWDSGPRSWRSS